MSRTFCAKLKHCIWNFLQIISKIVDFYNTKKCELNSISSVRICLMKISFVLTDWLRYRANELLCCFCETKLIRCNCKNVHSKNCEEFHSEIISRQMKFVFCVCVYSVLDQQIRYLVHSVIDTFIDIRLDNGLIDLKNEFKG